MGPLKLLIFQATPFCNLACTYCYLPDKSVRKRMPMEVIEKTLERLRETNIIGKEFSVVWHAGEPLAAGLEFYRKAAATIKAGVPEGVRVKHCFQTNGTLINDAWCDLFKEMENVSMGVSIDGPAFLHDKYRLNKQGRPTLQKVVEGIECLKKNGIPFHTISVVTKDAIDKPTEIFRFLHELGADSVAFNIEEVEGVNADSTIAQVREQEVGGFLKRIHEMSFAIGKPNYVREFRQSHMAVAGTMQKRRNQLTMETNPLSIITIDINGDFTSFSPELLSMKHERFGDFVIGNMLKDKMIDAVKSKKFFEMTREITAGVKRCAAECDYFHFCGGGSPSNKLFENGSFDSAETMHCSMTKKLVVDITLDRLEGMVREHMPEDSKELLGMMVGQPLRAEDEVLTTTGARA